MKRDERMSVGQCVTSVIWVVRGSSEGRTGRGDMIERNCWWLLVDTVANKTFYVHKTSHPVYMS